MRKKKCIIGLVGEIAAGKGSAVKYIEDKYNAESFRFSTPIRQMLDILKLEISRHNMQYISYVLRKNFSEDIFSKIIAADVKNSNKKITVVDGIRRPADLDHLKKMDNFKLIFIKADINIRYKRSLKRTENEDDNKKTFEQFKKDHQAETELQIPELSRQADHIVDNSGALDELYKKIDTIISECAN